MNTPICDPPGYSPEEPPLEGERAGGVEGSRIPLAPLRESQCRSLPMPRGSRGTGGAVRRACDRGTAGEPRLPFWGARTPPSPLAAVALPVKKWPVLVTFRK